MSQDHCLAHYDQVRKIIHDAIDKRIDDAQLKGLSVTFNQEAGETEVEPVDGFRRFELNGTFLLKINVGPFHTIHNPPPPTETDK